MTIYTPIRGIDANGDEFWYTGKSGKSFVSPNRAEAFEGYNLEGARRVATRLNGMSSMHGLRFIAVNGSDEAYNEES